MALPMILQGKEKNAECETWSQVGIPKFSANVAKKTERTHMCQFLSDLFAQISMESHKFWGPGRPCAGLGQGLGTGVQKNHFGTKPVTLLGAIFRVFRHFLTPDFSFIFEVTSDPELYALWWPKGAQKEVFGERFRG